MTGAPNELTENPEGIGADATDEILSAMRLSGGVFMDAQFTGDWSVAAQFVPEQCAFFFPVTGSLIGYHYVRSGTFWAEVKGTPPVKATAGSIIAIPRNDPHRLYTADVETIPTEAILSIDPCGIARIRHGTPGEKVEIFCGFLCTAGDDMPLLDHLPPILLIDHDSGLQSEWLEATLRFATQAPRPLATADVGSLAEIMIRATLKKHLNALAAQREPWFQALTDTFVARALNLIHGHYASQIDMDWLSRNVGLSKSAVHQRFTRLLGESPMRYCSRWRLRQAAHLLRETDSNSATVAHEVGFQSEAAFNRAFKREYGEPPAAWRKRKRKQLQAGVSFDGKTVDL